MHCNAVKSSLVKQDGIQFKCRQSSTADYSGLNTRRGVHCLHQPARRALTARGRHIFATHQLVGKQPRLRLCARKMQTSTLKIAPHTNDSLLWEEKSVDKNCVTSGISDKRHVSTDNSNSISSRGVDDSADACSCDILHFYAQMTDGGYLLNFIEFTVINFFNDLIVTDYVKLPLTFALSHPSRRHGCVEICSKDVWK